MESPTGRIPESLMRPELKAEVIRFIQAQAWPGDFKLHLFQGWVVTVGATATAAEFQIVENSGVDTFNTRRSR